MAIVDLVVLPLSELFLCVACSVMVQKTKSGLFFGRREECNLVTHFKGLLYANLLTEVVVLQQSYEASPTKLFEGPD